MGRGYAAAKARRQAAGAAAAAQGAVTEPVAPGAYNAEAPNPREEAYIAREIRSAKAAERSFDRMVDTISISYPHEASMSSPYYGARIEATISRDVLDAAIKMRSAADQTLKKLKQDYKNADSRDARIRANMGLNDLAIGIMKLNESIGKVRKVSKTKPNEKDRPRSAFLADSELVRARNDAISAFENIRRAATSARLDLAEIRNYPFRR